jgi:cytochrome c oxidase cbb3-type subunit 3
MVDSAGWYRSFPRETLTAVDVENPRAAHEGLLPKYSDQQMHDVFAYLETLK